MKPIRFFFFASLAALVLWSCGQSVSDSPPPSGDVTFDFDSKQDFSNYTTFSWASEQPMVVSSDYPVSQEVGDEIMSAIKKSMSKKGISFVETPSDADFAISFTVGARYDVDFFERETQFWPGYEFTYGETGASIARESVEGRLAIDIFDIERLTRVWHGVGSKDLARDELLSNDTIDDDMEIILSNFPPQD